MDPLGATLSLTAKNPSQRMVRSAGERLSSVVIRAQAARLVFSAYRFAVLPALRAFGGLGHECRFEPSCSHYAQEAFSRLSFVRALSLTMRRVLRCNPWTTAAIYDPLPESTATR
jgi:putative membrane protein insertion efficiency factor